MARISTARHAVYLTLGLSLVVANAARGQIELVHALGATDEGTKIASFSPRSDQMLQITAKKVIVRSVKTGRPLLQLEVRLDASRDQDRLLWAAWSPAGNRIATLTDGGIVQLWDAATAKLLHEQRVAHTAFLSHFLSDGRLIVYGAQADEADVLALWAPEGGGSGAFPIERRWSEDTLGRKTPLHVSDITSSRDSTRIATERYGVVQVWDIATRKEVANSGRDLFSQARFLSPTRLLLSNSYGLDVRETSPWQGRKITTDGQSPFCVSPDGQTVYAASLSSKGGAWDLQSGSQRFFAIDKTPTQIWLGADGKELVTLGGAVQVWNARTGQLLHTIGTPGTIRSFAAVGNLLATNHDDHLARVWVAGKQSLLVGGHLGDVRWAQLSPYGLVTADDHTVMSWNAESGALLAAYTHPASVSSLSMSPDGKSVLVGGSDGEVRLLGIRSLQQDISFPGDGSVTSALYSKDGSMVVSAHGDTVRTWDVKTGRNRLVLQAKLRVQAARFSRDGTWLATAEGETVRIFDAKSGKQHLALQACDLNASGTVVELDLDRAGRILASCEDDVSSLWDARTGKKFFTLSGNKARFSPNEQRILTMQSTSAVTLWDARSGKRQLDLEPDSPSKSRWSLAAWSPDNRQVVISIGNTLTQRDAQSGRLLGRATMNHQISSLAFDPTIPTRLVTGGAEYDQPPGTASESGSALHVWKLARSTR